MDIQWLGRDKSDISSLLVRNFRNLV